MGKMAEGLRKAGLISEEQSKEQEAGETKKEKERQKRDEFGELEICDCSALDGISDIEDFRRIAKRVILFNPSEIEGVLKVAHELQKKLKTTDATAGEQLIWLLEKIKDCEDDRIYTNLLERLD